MLSSKDLNLLKLNFLGLQLFQKLELNCFQSCLGGWIARLDWGCLSDFGCLSHCLLLESLVGNIIRGENKIRRE